MANTPTPQEIRERVKGQSSARQKTEQILSKIGLQFAATTPQDIREQMKSRSSKPKPTTIQGALDEQFPHRATLRNISFQPKQSFLSGLSQNVQQIGRQAKSGFEGLVRGEFGERDIRKAAVGAAESIRTAPSRLVNLPKTVEEVDQMEGFEVVRNKEGNPLLVRGDFGEIASVNPQTGEIGRFIDPTGAAGVLRRTGVNLGKKALNEVAKTTNKQAIFNTLKKSATDVPDNVLRNLSDELTRVNNPQAVQRVVQNRLQGLGKGPKQIDNLTKNEMIEAIDYIRLKKPYNQVMEENIGKLAEKFGVRGRTLPKVADELQDLVEKTKTLDMTPRPLVQPQIGTPRFTKGEGGRFTGSVGKEAVSLDKTAEAFTRSTKQTLLKELGDVKFEIGSFGRNAFARKVSQPDRLPSGVLRESLDDIVSVYKAGDTPFRKDNIVWIAKKPNNELHAIVTRKNQRGAEEIINAFRVGRDQRNFIENLRKFGVPDRSRTGIAGLEDPRFIHLSYEDIFNVAKPIGNVKRGGENLFGGVAGVELDEEGNISFDPAKAAAGVAGMAGIRKVQGRVEPINLRRLNISPKAKQATQKTINSIKPELDEIRGTPLTNKEVLDAAKTSDVLRGSVSRESTKRAEAALLRTRQHLAQLAKGENVSKEFIDTLRIVRASAADKARQLQALGIQADPELGSIKSKVIADLVDMGKTTDEILEAAKNVDFNNAEEVTMFYRQFVKPTLPELVDEFRYINLLSSPRTHIINAFSNLIQAVGLNPATKLATGSTDFIASKLTGRARQQYVAEVPAYYKGVFNSLGDASIRALDVIRGKSAVHRPDISRIPTGNRFLGKFRIIPRTLEAGDVFFRTLIEEGEKNAMLLKAQKSGKSVSEANILREAQERASYWVFRQALDPSNKTGQGRLLSAIDKTTSAVYRFRDVPVVKWFIPFVQTPMNILKQGIEFSPIGFTTLPGSARKTEQLGKMMVGSTIFGVGAHFAMNDRTTWAAPINEKQREAFYASGMQPYSIKIGDTWVSYSKLGPVAYPLAMSAALKWYISENPAAATQTALEKTTNVMSAIAGFITDQSYLQGIGDLVDLAQGDERALTNIATNVPSQLIPVSSFQRWAAQLVDPVYRQTDSSLTPGAIARNLAIGLPFFSKTVEPYTNPAGEESVRQMRFFNAFSPLGLTKEDDAFQIYYENLLDHARREKVSNANRDFLKTQAQETYDSLKVLPQDQARVQFDSIIQENPELAKEINEILEDDRKGLTYEDKFIKSMGVENGERASFIFQKVMQLSENERGKYYQSLIDKGVVTKQVSEQVEKLRQNPDALNEPDIPRLDKESYNEGGIIETVLLYARALGTDPSTAFNRIITGERIVKIESGAIIVQRIPLEESEAIRSERGVTAETADELRLDHTVPLQLGGSNSEGNLKLVPFSVWQSYTPVENHLGRLLRDGKIKKERAQKLIRDFKAGKISANEILQL